ncbi:MAG TPA: fatty acid desaturase [Enhygromyxa sp.]|nr:fatty acid desaturase [Enhygromyxa sp.]
MTELRLRVRELRELDPRRSWRLLAITIALLVGAWTPVFLPIPWPLRLLDALLVGGLLLRLCSFGHDYLHGAILVRSKLARVVFTAVGLLVLAPPRAWNDTHNFHHAHNGKLPAQPIGAFPLLTAAAWREASPGMRVIYRLARSPLAMLLAWPGLFVLGLNLRYFLKNPRRYLSSGAALLLHGLAHALVWTTMGPLTWALALAVPYTVMSTAGAYLFYVQHNFPGAVHVSEAAWDRRDAALTASSYLGLPGWLHWFTGNIGYHHIHHYDVRVPFYRLPEAFATIPEFNRSPDSSLAPIDVARAFALVCFDEQSGRMLAARELR